MKGAARPDHPKKVTVVVTTARITPNKTSATEVTVRRVRRLTPGPNLEVAVFAPSMPLLHALPIRHPSRLCRAHRPACTERANLILSLDHGHVVERGTDDALVARNGLYARLYPRNIQDPGAGSPDQRPIA